MAETKSITFFNLILRRQNIKLFNKYWINKHVVQLYCFWTSYRERELCLVDWLPFPVGRMVMRVSLDSLMSCSSPTVIPREWYPINPWRSRRLHLLDHQRLELSERTHCALLNKEGGNKFQDSSDSFCLTTNNLMLYYKKQNILFWLNENDSLYTTSHGVFYIFWL